MKDLPATILGLSLHKLRFFFGLMLMIISVIYAIGMIKSMLEVNFMNIAIFLVSLTVGWFLVEANEKRWEQIEDIDLEKKKLQNEILKLEKQKLEKELGLDKK